MKILHIITSLKLGGAETMLYRFLAQSSQDQRYQHVVAYFYDGPFVKKIRDLGVPVIKISGLFFCYDFVAFYRLNALINSFKPTLIHSSLWSANIIARLFAFFYQLPLMCDLHGNAAHEGSVRNLLDSITATIPKKIVAVADGVKTAYEKTIIGAQRDQAKRTAVTQSLVVIKNGIDVCELHEYVQQAPLARCELGLHENDFVIGSVGRLDAIKSYDVLVKAFAVLLTTIKPAGQPVKLCLVGGGQDEEKIKALVAQLGISAHVVLTGARADGARFYQLFECFALSSQSEGLSVAVLEAMAFGLPIVSTCAGKSHEVLVDGTNGFLVPVNDEQALANALQQLYDKRSLAVKMGRANRDLVECDYALDCMVARYHALYDELGAT
ncbi:glycosyltransferase [bacterium]|nr:MAG: glycosyltransferase [bacterium]